MKRASGMIAGAVYNRSRVVIAMMAVMLLCGVRPAAAGPDRNGKAVAFAKVSTNDGTIRSVGGAKTASATATIGPAGVASVTFTGKYPAGLTVDQVIVQATCQSGAFNVANAQVLTASPTSIEVSVACFRSNDLSFGLGNAFVTLFIGR